MAPLTWLQGAWTGSGSGGFPTMNAFEYDNQIRVRYLDEAFDVEPLIQFEEIAWVYENDERRFKHWETGFFKPTEDDRIQFYISHNTGRIEVTYGQCVKIDPNEKSFELILESNFIRNDVGLKTAHKSFRTIVLKNGSLNYSLDMTTEDIADPTFHLEATLERSTY